MAQIYNNSKTFVEKPMKQPPNETLARFDEFMKQYSDGSPPNADILVWVDKYFDATGTEFESWVPKDFKENPAVFKKIKDKELQEFATALNKIWLQLGRKIKTKVRDNPELYSIFWVDNPVIVTGGRFLEYYYWDSYWIIQGLLRSEMFDVS